MSKKINLETTQSHHRGLKGLFEGLLRRFKSLAHLASMIPVYSATCLLLGLCAWPGVLLYHGVQRLTEDTSWWIQDLGVALSLSFGFFLYGFTLIFATSLVNFCLGKNLKAWKGPYYSAESFRWFLHNGLTYLVRFTFLEFVTPSPISLLFYRMMGMKIGQGTIINSTWISDPSLITIGEKVTIGGSVTIVAHYGQAGLLVIAPVKIGDNCTIGIKATVMGGVEIGAGAKIMPHSVVLPKTKIPPGESWGGVPAVKLHGGKNPTRLAS